MEWIIPLADLDFGPDESRAVLEVLESRWLTMGAVTQTFEEEFAAFTGTRHALAVTNATAGLHLACVAAGLGAGDEVILPSLTFVATAAAVLYAGAMPVFADIHSEHDLTLSPTSIEKSITPRTKAIMLMHYGGYACDMPAILTLAERHGLQVLEDAAHAPGSSLNQKHLGTWGRVGVFSFFSNKNLATGEGGMVVTDDEKLAERLRSLRSHAMTTLTWDRHRGHAWSYDVADIGYNYRLDEIRSAIGLVQLRKLERNNQTRRDLINLYQQLFQAQVPEIGLPFRHHAGISAGHLMPILLPKGCDRIRFMGAMKAQGIQTSIHYPPIHTFSYYRNRFPGISLPITEQIAEREVTLPLYPGMKEEQVKTVVEGVRNVLS
jgi:dTDP-4-amino-4,6-dideoxygalactose transaminase